MTRIALAFAAICVILLSALPVFAEEDAEEMKNVAVVKACLAIADAKEEAARDIADNSSEEEKVETSPEAYFAASATEAARQAGYARENCIGVVAYPCTEAAG
jgi:fructoselysine-6-P-deglycase FrlB-like protein